MPGTPEKLQAVADALKYECPSEWQADLARALPANDPRQIFILATVHGYRRIKAGDGWFIGTEVLPPTTLRTVAWAIGRIGHSQAKTLLQTWLRHEDVTLRSAALAAV